MDKRDDWIGGDPRAGSMMFENKLRKAATAHLATAVVGGSKQIDA